MADIEDAARYGNIQEQGGCVFTSGGGQKGTPRTPQAAAAASNVTEKSSREIFGLTEKFTTNFDTLFLSCFLCIEYDTHLWE